MRCCQKPSPVSAPTSMNKASQFVSESLGLAHATDYGEPFLSKHRFVENRHKLGNKLKTTSRKLLYPSNNIVSRLKMSANATTKEHPEIALHPEASIGEAMLSGVEEMGSETVQACEFSRLLYESSIAMKNLAILRSKLIEDVNAYFIKPTSNLKKDYEQLQRLHKKLESRRLDYDARKRKASKAKASVADEEEMRIAERKFLDLKALTEDAMGEFILRDADRAYHLRAFNRVLLNYHRQAADVMEQLVANEGAPPSAKSSLSESRMVSLKFSTLHIHPDPGPASLLKRSNSSELRSPGGQSSYAEERGYTFPIRTSAKFVDCSMRPASGEKLQTPPPPMSLEVCEALEDFEPTANDHRDTLSFKKGEQLQVVGIASEDGWLWARTMSGQLGYAPANFVARLNAPVSITPPHSDEHNLESPVDDKPAAVVDDDDDDDADDDISDDDDPNVDYQSESEEVVGPSDDDDDDVAASKGDVRSTGSSREAGDDVEPQPTAAT